MPRRCPTYSCHWLAVSRPSCHGAQHGSASSAAQSSPGVPRTCLPVAEDEERAAVRGAMARSGSTRTITRPISKRMALGGFRRSSERGNVIPGGNISRQNLWLYARFRALNNNYIAPTTALLLTRVGCRYRVGL